MPIARLPYEIPRRMANRKRPRGTQEPPCNVQVRNKIAVILGSGVGKINLLYTITCSIVRRPSKAIGAHGRGAR